MSYLHHVPTASGEFMLLEEAHFVRKGECERRQKDKESDKETMNLIKRVEKKLRPLLESPDNRSEKWCYKCETDDHYSDEDDKHTNKESAKETINELKQMQKELRPLMELSDDGSRRKHFFVGIATLPYSKRFLRDGVASHDDRTIVLNGPKAPDFAFEFNKTETDEMVDKTTDMIMHGSPSLSPFQLICLKETVRILVIPRELRISSIGDRYDRPIPHYLGLRLKKEHKLCTTAMATIQKRQADSIFFSSTFALPRTVDCMFTYFESPPRPLLNHGKFMKGNRFF